MTTGRDGGENPGAARGLGREVRARLAGDGAVLGRLLARFRVYGV